MNIMLYKTTSAPNVLTKNLVSPKTYSGYFRKSTTISNPTVIVTDNPNGYNYAYSKTLGAYYFIDRCTLVRTGLWSLELRIDVLMTAHDEILELKIVTEKASDGNPYIRGGAPRNVVPKVSRLTFPNKLVGYDKGSVVCIARNEVSK